MRTTTFEQFCRERGLVGDGEVQGHIHAGLRSAPNTTAYRRRHTTRLIQLQDARDAARALYRAAIAQGEIREATREERLAITAAGHDDNPSTQAARRVIAKRKTRARTLLPCLRPAAVWAAIDRLAREKGLTRSGLAVRAGLNCTTFNPSKRLRDDGVWRWPGMESIVAVLTVTETSLTTFAQMIEGAVNAEDDARADGTP